MHKRTHKARPKPATERLRWDRTAVTVATVAMMGTRVAASWSGLAIIIATVSSASLDRGFASYARGFPCACFLHTFAGRYVRSFPISQCSCRHDNRFHHDGLHRSIILCVHLRDLHRDVVPLDDFTKDRVSSITTREPIQERIVSYLGSRGQQQWRLCTFHVERDCPAPVRQATLMKNWEPPESGWPVLAMDKVPLTLLSSERNSSSETCLHPATLISPTSLTALV